MFIAQPFTIVTDHQSLSINQSILFQHSYNVEDPEQKASKAWRVPRPQFLEAETKQQMEKAV